MTDPQLIEFYKNNAELFVNNSIVDGAGRWLSWGFVKIVVWMADKCKALYDYSFGMIDFTSSKAVNQFIDAFKPAFIALLAFSLLALGIILVVCKEKKPKVFINICVAVLCISCGTVVFQAMNGLAVSFKDGVDKINVSGQKYDGVYDVVSNNLYDLVYLDKKLGMKNINYEKNEKNLPHADISKKSFQYIDYREVLNPDSSIKYSSKGDAKDILGKKLVPISYVKGDEKFEVREVYNGFGWNSEDDADIANEFYYRYNFKFFLSLLQLISIIIIYVAMSYKCVRIAYELVVARLLAYLYSAEISGGQKIAKILCFIRDSYILLMITCLCIRFFYIMNAFIQKNISNDFVAGVLIAFVAFCVIDGPNLVEKLLGMDAGLKASTARLLAIYGGIKAAARSTAAIGKAGAGAILGSGKGNKESDRISEKMNKDHGKNDEHMDKDADGKGGEGMSGMDDTADKDGKEKDRMSNSADDSQQADYMNAATDLEGAKDDYMNDAAAAESGTFGEGGAEKEFMDKQGSFGSDKGQRFAEKGRSDSKNEYMNVQDKKERESSFKRPQSNYSSDVMDRLNENREDKS